MLCSNTTTTQLLKNYQLITDPQDVGQLLSELDKHDLIAFDVETTGLDYKRDDLHGLSFATEDREWYIAGPAWEATFAHPGLKQIMNDPAREIIGHNLLFDLHFAARYGLRPPKIFDTMIAQWLIDENQEIGLKTLAQTKLHIIEHLPDFQEMRKAYKPLLGRRRIDDVSIFDLPLHKLAEYGARDSRLTYDLRIKSAYELDKESMTGIFTGIEMPFVYVLLDMEEAGFFIDQKLLAEMGIDFEEKKQAALEKWNELTGGVNPNSPQQLQEYLYEIMGYKPTLFTDSGQPSTDVLALTRLMQEDKNGAVTALMDYKKFDKLISTYVLNVQNSLLDGRLYGNFRRTGTVTGRLSSGGGGINLQNIPARTEEGAKIGKRLHLPLGT